jgi:hypothetical protein
MSFIVLLNAVELMVEPVTTGFPGVYGENVPAPLKGMLVP